MHLDYLAHKNPDGTKGGKIYGYGEACERSRVCRLSEISDLSSVWESDISGSLIIGSTVVKSLIKNSLVINTLVSSGANICDSVIKAEAVTGSAEISHSVILENSRVSHNAVVRFCRFKNLTVKGDAVLNWKNDRIFDGASGYISRGVWYRPPKIFKVSEHLTVTESVKGFAYVHCREYPIDFLLKIGNRLGRSQNWSNAQIKAVRRILHYLSKN